MLNVGNGGGSMVLAMEPRETLDVYAIYPSDISAGWKKVSRAFPSLAGSSSLTAVAVHCRTTVAFFDRTHKPANWMYYYDAAAGGRFVDMGPMDEGLPNRGGTSKMVVAVPATLFPECRDN